MSFDSPSTALRPSVASPADGSRTITITTDPTRENNQDHVEDPGPGAPVVGVLRLRGTRRTGPRVAWDDDVVDNEHMGKKKSKSMFSNLTCTPHFLRQETNGFVLQSVASIINHDPSMSLLLMNRRQILMDPMGPAEERDTTTTVTRVETADFMVAITATATARDQSLRMETKRMSRLIASLSQMRMNATPKGMESQDVRQVRLLIDVPTPLFTKT